jgi:hypothetical protein
MELVKPDGKRPCGRHRYKWKDNITVDLKEIAWEGELDSSGSV